MGYNSKAMVVTLLNFFAHLHPVFIHFPIAIVFLLLIIFFFNKRHPNSINEKLNFFIIKVWVFFSLLTVGSGFFLSQLNNYENNFLDVHTWLGFASLGIFGVTACVYRLKNDLYGIFLIVSVIFSTATGYFGGSVHYGDEYLDFFRQREKTRKKFKLYKNPHISEYYQRVQPIFDRNCYSCHRAEVQKSGYALGSFKEFINSNSGKTLFSAGSVHAGSLIRVITEERFSESHMPKFAGMLDESEIEIIKNWIKKYENQEIQISASGNPSMDKYEHWSFKKFDKPEVPDISFENYSGNEIDAFIWEKLKNSELTPGPKAAWSVLEKRLHVDLSGLYPQGDESSEPTKMRLPARLPANLIESLISKISFAEKWALSWLDLVRYADSYGFEYDNENEYLAPYRNFVISSLNNDVPVNEFLKLQIAGDQYLPNIKVAQVASGYLLAGPYHAEGRGIEKQYLRADDILGSTVGLTLGMDMKCARCHNHKTEPITQADYYAMASPFFQTLSKKISETGSDYSKRFLGMDPIDMTHTISDEVVEFVSAVSEPKFDRGMKLLIRGNIHTPGDLIPFSFMDTHEGVNSDPEFWESLIRKKYKIEEQQPGMRWVFSEWLTDTANGMGMYVARVMVDHVWREIFGVGLVSTPGSFGAKSPRPIHEKLLNWLAHYFVEQGWSLKKLLTLILNSHTYQSTSRGDELATNEELDLYKYRRIKFLKPEEIRDNLLLVSGALENKPHSGKFVDEIYVNQENIKKNWAPNKGRPLGKYRSIYMQVMRNNVYPLFYDLGYPNRNLITYKRLSPVTAKSSMTFLNSEYFKKYSRKLTEAVTRNFKAIKKDRFVENVYKKVYRRSPTQKEKNLSMELLGGSEESKINERMVNLTHALLVSNEFTMVE